jgi:DNA gyrase subunit A
VLAQEIAGLVHDKKIDGISDIRDESDRHGIRLVIELRRGEVADVILNNLYKHTKLQQSFGMIFIAIQNNQPRVFPLRDLLTAFLDFRKEVVVRRTAFELRKAEERAHILEGLVVALDHLDEVITIIRSSKTPPEAKAALCAKVWPDVTPSLARLGTIPADGFRFSEVQAQAILDMRLQRLTGLERDKIVEEYEEVLKLIARLREILASEAHVLKIVRDELSEIRRQFADERRTKILENVKDLTIEELIAEEEMVITVSHAGYCKRPRCRPTAARSAAARDARGWRRATRTSSSTSSSPRRTTTSSASRARAGCTGSRSRDPGDRARPRRGGPS